MSTEDRFAMIPFAAIAEITDLGMLKVYAALAAYSDRSGSAWASYPILATATGMHVSTVARAVGRLRKAGWLEIEKAGKGRRATLYWLPKHPRRPSADGESTATRNSRRPSTATPTQTRRNDADPESASVTVDLASAPTNHSYIPINRPSHHRNGREGIEKREKNLEPPPDRLVAYALTVFAPKYTPDQVRDAINQIRHDDNIADQLIEMAITQARDANAQHLTYVRKVASDFYRQRTGGEPPTRTYL